MNLLPPRLVVDLLAASLCIYAVSLFRDYWRARPARLCPRCAHYMKARAELLASLQHAPVAAREPWDDPLPLAYSPDYLRQRRERSAILLRVLQQGALPLRSKPSKEAFMENPTNGRTVNFVMKDGTTRGLVVTRCTGRNINGVLHLDGRNDDENLPEEMTRTTRTGPNIWVEDIPHHEATDISPPVAGTWHWPLKAALAATV